MPGKWIRKALPASSKGKLHKALGVPEDKKISANKLTKAEHSKSPTMRKRAVLAKTLSKMNKNE